MICPEEAGDPERSRPPGRSALTNQARLHGSVEVVGESVEDAAALHLVRLVHLPLDHPHHLVVAQLVARVA